MSTDWGIGCVPCAAAHRPKDGYTSGERGLYFSGEWDNCRDVDALWKLIRARSEVVKVWRLLGEAVSFYWSPYGFDSCRASGLAEFFAVHEGHALEPMDEYGRFSDECYLHVQCGECQTARRCVLKAGHEGACSVHKAGPQ